MTRSRVAMAMLMLVSLATSIALVAIPATAADPGVTQNYWASQAPEYVGWATVKSAGWTHLSAYPVAREDTRIFGSTQAWKWNYPGWSSIAIPHNTRVWTAYYAPGWTWAWTSSTGWVAISSNRVLIREQVDACTQGGFGCPIR